MKIETLIAMVAPLTLSRNEESKEIAQAASSGYKSGDFCWMRCIARQIKARYDRSSGGYRDAILDHGRNVDLCLLALVDAVAKDTEEEWLCAARCFERLPRSEKGIHEEVKKSFCYSGNEAIEKYYDPGVYQRMEDACQKMADTNAQICREEAAKAKAWKVQWSWKIFPPHQPLE